MGEQEFKKSVIHHQCEGSDYYKDDKERDPTEYMREYHKG